MPEEPQLPIYFPILIWRNFTKAHFRRIYFPETPLLAAGA
jgi:hypothetical protein